MLGLRSWLLFGALLVPLPALAEMQVIWPQGWEVSRSPVDAAADAPVIRQRGVRLAEDGSQDLVMEVTRSRLGSGVRVSAENVIVEMRKALQKDFMRQGFQAACSKPLDTLLGGLEGLEVHCGISQNGTEVLKQTVQVALGDGAAYSLTYAAPAQRYAELLQEIETVKAGISLR
ncbi:MULTISPECIES: DUF4946 domain-containing protein [Pseudomonas]|uniref:DUF4946 domain-containing protein n=1 Tax=Pseudomonas nitroreducens TaxID=46680 RepID=A0A6G6IWW6_PSENT|nr:MULTISPECIES: DUF4946 domain-containing protein [Pseudomonas]NMZ61054.1 DUF4946 domain-containing protein [Pseudomonas nitroreducens]OBY48861.1 DUF4946 domain-containing protein [Pseudomonas sp. AU12215]QIE86721.1 DUF4946 domain-containing protein [Pseudomonas nitroreducens]WEW95614.1 DUF4946 domain-containing protein [Pseudomonas nitroreducens]SNT46797.1 protein of unknown function [Pseudomonas nitroreducens]